MEGNMRPPGEGALDRGAVIMLKRFGPVLAGLVVVAALAIGVPSATGHPEVCSTAAAWASMDGGYSPYASWQGAEEEKKATCASSGVTSRYDDSSAELGEGETGTAGLRLIASKPKTGPFAGEAPFNSDLAFENGYAYQGNYEGVSIWDVRDPQNPTLVNQIHCPGSQNDVTINDVSGQNYRCANTGPQSHDKISIVEVPKANPAEAQVVNMPV